jgi:hypothetical protein
MRIVTLTKGYSAQVDDADFEFVSQWKWYVQVQGGRIYARRDTWDKQTKRRVKIYMHRALMAPPQHLHVDHIDHDGLNNQRSNLRVATNSQNSANGRHSVGRSGYRGVEIVARCRAAPFSAYISVDGRKRHVGRFHSAEEAAIARDVAALKQYGQFAKLNFSAGIPAAWGCLPSEVRK